MTGANELWNWASPVWLVAGALLGGYLAVVRHAGHLRFVALAIGLALLVLAFVSPVGVLADGYLFSAHMVQHLLLLLVIPLCLLLAVPQEQAAAWIDNARFDRLGRGLGVAVVGWIAGVGAMWFWHVPTFCSAAAASPMLGAARDLSFLAAGTAFWWPIYAPADRYRLDPLAGIVYLFSACLGCTLLGIYITFTSVAVCPAFANPAGHAALMSRFYAAGFTPAVDQHLGGLLMWVPPCFLYVGAIISLLCRWYGTMDNPPDLLPRLSLPAGGQSTR